MHHVKIAVFLLAAGITSVAQDAGQVQPQLTPVPPKPTCHWIFNTGPCNDLWKAYNQALAQRQREELQLYVDRQKQLASSQASAPLQQQITELNKQVADLTNLSGDQQEQIKRLQEQMQVDAVAASQAKADAHKQGLELGAGIGVGSMVLFFALIFTVKKITGSTGKPLVRSASA
jgi:uncharacterized protein YlxW (UPF0749 family)